MKLIQANEIYFAHQSPILSTHKSLPAFLSTCNYWTFNQKVINGQKVDSAPALGQLSSLLPAELGSKEYSVTLKEK